MSCSIFTRDVVSGKISKSNKKKKDHQNRTIINEIEATSVLIKVQFLWTITQVKSPTTAVSCVMFGTPQFDNL